MLIKRHIRSNAEVRLLRLPRLHGSGHLSLMLAFHWLVVQPDAGKQWRKKPRGPGLAPVIMCHNSTTQSHEVSRNSSWNAVCYDCNSPQYIQKALIWLYRNQRKWSCRPPLSLG